MKCDDCKYYRLRAHGFGHREGECFRYPVTTTKSRADFCGEYRKVTKKKE